MNRLQSKCVLASATLHGLLFAIIIVGSAFVKAPPRPENIKTIRLIPNATITDDETQGGGNPIATSEPPPAAPANLAPPVTQVIQEPPIKLPDPPQPKPEVKKPVHKPETKPETKPEPKPDKKPEAKKPEPKPDLKVVKNNNSKKIVPKAQLTDKPPEPKPEKPKIQVDLTNVKNAAKDPDFEERRRKKEEAAREAREQRLREEAAAKQAQREYEEGVARANQAIKARQQALSGIVGNIENKMSIGTVVEMPEGPGGAAFINYSEFIWAKYYQAWQTPEDRQVATPVRVEIVVARDGRVISANIVGRSGDSVLDNSVRQALDRVRKLPAFPEASKDVQRTFKISFSLNIKNRRG